ncbi:anaerobic benzoate catabolism transcriptional regulator [Clostridium puniceum]|uniref:Anaerobic benzoate catabolism transcriptional regulator n=2 Tax=Clostridium puniceum TaxID=29367 RepID=A0A1S8TBF4_9CLOT|nr:anaerobic benzoate catabolism transcriptional regulator [Clostridium puniceum]
MDIKKAVGHRIRDLRTKREWSQEELALRAEISLSHMGRLERGERGATIHSLEKVINALDITFVDLFRFLDENNTEVDTKTLNDIIDKLRKKSLKDQQIILNLIDILSP